MTSLLAEDARVEQLWTGAEWTEGPLWVPSRRVVLFSDIPNDRVLAYDAATGETAVDRQPAGYQNGRTLDADGSIVHCSHGGRRVEREVDGALETIADGFDGVRLNSPNDVVVARDGSVWFTDPPYGIDDSGREGHPGDEEYGGCFVFRLDPATGDLRPVVTDMEHPNGLAFSRDETVLYVADTGAPQHVRAYDVTDGGCENGRVLLTVPEGAVDGLRVDAADRLWCSAGDGVHVFSAEGEHLEHVPVPEVVSNLCFGGDALDELYITGTTSLYRVRLAAPAL